MSVPFGVSKADILNAVQEKIVARFRDPNKLNGRLSISVIEAILLKNYGISKMDPFCVVSIGHMNFVTDVASDGGITPRWNADFQCDLQDGEEYAYVKIFDKRLVQRNLNVAWTSIKIPEDTLSVGLVDKWYSLSGKLGERKEGTINIAFSFSPKTCDTKVTSTSNKNIVENKFESMGISETSDTTISANSNTSTNSNISANSNTSTNSNISPSVITDEAQLGLASSSTSIENDASMISKGFSNHQMHFVAGGRSADHSNGNSGKCQSLPDSCGICEEEEAVVTFQPCEHKIACRDCGLKLKKCFECASPISKKLVDGVDITQRDLAGNPTLSSVNQQGTDENQICPICMDCKYDTAFLCGHVVCGSCAKLLMGKDCHMCRKPVTGFINIYTS